MMVTNEYDALTLVLSSKYNCKVNDQGVFKMEETFPNQPPQVINLKSSYSGVDGIKLYRPEDRGAELLLPFFNHNNRNTGEERKAPKYLVCMCDYFCVCSYRDKTFFFLFELKRGTTTDYQKQLDAGECFFRYICDTIDRIKSYDGIAFDRTLISVKKFQIKKVKSNKQTIQPSHSINGDGVYFTIETNNELGLLRCLFNA